LAKDEAWLLGSASAHLDLPSCFSVIPVMKPSFGLMLAERGLKILWGEYECTDKWHYVNQLTLRRE
jgi:hypothetical protein